MISNPLEGVIKRRQNTTLGFKNIPQDGYITSITDSSRLANDTITETKNITTRRHVVINDPMQPEVTYITAPRKPRNE